jgi:hypothetical protein
MQLLTKNNYHKALETDGLIVVYIQSSRPEIEADMKASVEIIAHQSGVTTYLMPWEESEDFRLQYFIPTVPCLVSFMDGMFDAYLPGISTRQDIRSFYNDAL